MSPSAERLASFALLDALVCDAPVGLGYWDHELRYRRLNDRMAELAGATVEAHLGRTPPEMLGSLGETLQQHIGGVLRSGETALEVEVSGATPATPDEERHWRFSFYPVEATSAASRGVGATAIEITTERRAADEDRRAADVARRAEADDNARRAEVLAAASAALSSSLEPSRVVEALAQALVPQLADWCAIHTAQPSGNLQLVAVAGMDRRRQALLRELAQRFPPTIRAAAGAGAVVRTGRPEIHSNIAEELLAAAATDDEHLRILRDLDLRSAVVLPLRSRRRVLGALTLVMGESGRRYGGDRLELAESVAAQAAAALENAGLYSEQVATAQALQRSLLPPALPQIAGVELGAYYRPAGRATEVGGDFYDVFASADGWSFVIGDVVGKGAQAAAITGVVRFMLRGAELAQVPLVAKLRCVNDELLTRTVDVEFCSAVYGHLQSTHDGVLLELVSCGHPPPLVQRGDGSIETVPLGGPILGLAPDPSFKPSEVRLAPGDALVLYTDGVIELPGRNPWRGMTLLHETVGAATGASAEHLIERVTEATLEASAGTPRDDLALLVIRAQPEG